MAAVGRNPYTRQPSNVRRAEQLAQIQEMRDVGLSLYTPDGFREFLRTPLPIFGGRTALQMIEQGNIEEVVGALTADYEGLGY